MFKVHDCEDERERNKRKPFYKKEKLDKGYSSLLMSADASGTLPITTDFQIFKGKKKHGFKLIKTKNEKKSVDYEAKERRSRLLEQLRLIVGCPLEEAVKRNPLANSSELAVPKFLIECIAIIDQGHSQENIYRHEAVKIKQAADLEYALKQPLTAEFAASLLKRFFKELPEPILTHEQINTIIKIITDSGSGITNATSDSYDTTKANEVHLILQKIPKCNRDTLYVLFNHLHRIITSYSASVLLSSGGTNTNMQTQTVISSLVTVLKIKERVVKYLIQNVNEVFDKQNISTITTVPRIPLMKNVSRSSLLPDSIEELENELTKQENILNKMHEDMQKQTTSSTFGTTTPTNVDKEKEEQLWAQQRMVTAIKRKIKQETRRLQQTISNRQSSALSFDAMSPLTFTSNTPTHRKSLVKDGQISPSQQVIIIVNKNKRDNTPTAERVRQYTIETPKTVESSISPRTVTTNDSKLQLGQRRKSDDGKLETDESGNEDDIFIKTLFKNKVTIMEKNDEDSMQSDYLKEKILEHRLVAKLKKLYEAFMHEKKTLEKLEQMHHQSSQFLASPEQQLSSFTDATPALPPPLPQRPSEISQSKQSILPRPLNNGTMKLSLPLPHSLPSSNNEITSPTKLKDDTLAQNFSYTSPDQRISILQELLNTIKQNNQLENILVQKRYITVNDANLNAGEKKLIKILEKRFPEATKISVSDVSGGCGASYEINIISSKFKNMKTINQHRQVSEALADELPSIHSVRIFTATDENHIV
ncbi:unnamed protein product [Didymodactylos carnosus]|uniref:Rho-GAP domain-containing protein n=1 Tax=Didymodactylos carnosus TaxID=1234261 RepID=A0A813P1K7_9BILA|nr:unnamed protein product [Didymodactylos carnosus]CAF0751440.1 unnamed protein product [Didymodactylos carnosus]CAF3524797.1 unnamed protein product [Didymodactylos carnosus]CAF3530246.1 unnamed protein product [Didymodactylos carnosus]